MKSHVGFSFSLFMFLLNLWIAIDVCCGNQAFDAENGESFKFGQVVEKEKTAHNVKSKRKLFYQIENGQNAAVYDNLIPSEVSSNLLSYVTQNGDPWVFDDYDNAADASQMTPDSVAWVTFKDPLSFANSSLAGILAAAITDMSGKDMQLYPYKVMGKVIRRGDVTTVTSDSLDEGDYSALVYLNSQWKKNWYGETFFYNSNKDIICGVTPNMGRVVAWDASALRLMRPPAVSYSKGQILFHVFFSTSKEKMLENHKKFVERRDKRANANKNWYMPDYKPKDSSTFVPDPAKHLTAKLTNKKGRRIFVFDGLFPDDILYGMRNHVLNYGHYFYDDSDDDPTSDNVHWIAGYPVQEYIQSPFWNITKKVLQFASGKNTLFPYDVAVNLIRSADHTRIHKDCNDNENEWTFLVYLNPGLTLDHYGETVFFEKQTKVSDVIGEVRPRFGRVALFEGAIPHSARPPSSKFKGARLSFVVKSSVNEKLARRKCFVQELSHFGHSVSLNQRLLDTEDEDREPAELTSFNNALENAKSADDILSLHTKMDKKHAMFVKENGKLILERL